MSYGGHDYEICVGKIDSDQIYDRLIYITTSPILETSLPLNGDKIIRDFSITYGLNHKTQVSLWNVSISWVKSAQKWDGLLHTFCVLLAGLLQVLKHEIWNVVCWRSHIFTMVVVCFNGCNNSEPLLFTWPGHWPHAGMFLNWSQQSAGSKTKKMRLDSWCPKEYTRLSMW